MPNPNGDEYPSGFLEPWFWNFFLSAIQWYTTLMCSGVGWMGLFWWNDGGLMMNRCFLINKGVIVNYEGLLSS